MCVPECAQVLGMPKAKCEEGRGHQPTSTALGRQQAGRLHVAHSHATESARIACNNNTQHTLSKIPKTWSHRTCNMPLVRSHHLSRNSSQLPTPLPRFPSKPTFTKQAAVQPRKESILDPTRLIILIERFISYQCFALYIFIFMVSLIKVQLDSDASILYQVKISLNAKRVQYLKGCQS